MNKKGLSQAVGFVLLVGLSIGLAVFVGTWLRGQSEKTAQGLAEDVEKNTRCDDTLIRAIANCDRICRYDGNNCVNNQNARNRGGCDFFDEDQIGCERNSGADGICIWMNSNCEDDTGCGEYDTENECNTQAEAFIHNITFENKGLFSITKLKCNGEDVPFNLKPDEKKEMGQQPLNNCVNTRRVVVIPFIELSNGDDFGCTSKRVILQC